MHPTAPAMTTPFENLPAIVATGADDLRGLVGVELPPTAWLSIRTEQLAMFDNATFDGPSTNYRGAAGASTVHGTHTLSLVVPLWERTVGVLGLSRVALYGLDRVRFPAPVAVGSRVRGCFRLVEVQIETDGMTYRVAAAIEREGQPKPACVADLVFRGFV